MTPQQPPGFRKGRNFCISDVATFEKGRWWWRGSNHYVPRSFSCGSPSAMQHDAMACHGKARLRRCCVEQGGRVAKRLARANRTKRSNSSIPRSFARSCFFGGPLLRGRRIRENRTRHTTAPATTDHPLEPLHIGFQQPQRKEEQERKCDP